MAAPYGRGSHHGFQQVTLPQQTSLNTRSAVLRAEWRRLRQYPRRLPCNTREAPDGYQHLTLVTAQWDTHP